MTVFANTPYEIPGSDLLNMAFRLIAQESITYYKFISRALSVIGQDVATYAAPVQVRGSFQPVPKSLYTTLGLDLEKSYYTFYASENIIDILRDVSGDQLAYNGRRYQVESNNDWYDIDGWKGILCVYIGPDS